MKVLGGFVPIRHRGPIPIPRRGFRTQRDLLGLRITRLDAEGKPLRVVEPPPMRIPRGGMTGFSRGQTTRRYVSLETWWEWRGAVYRHREWKRYGQPFVQPPGTWDGYTITESKAV